MIIYSRYIVKKEKEPTYPKDRNYFCSRKEEDRYREKKERENGGNGRHDNAINRDIFSGRGRVIWAGVRCQWVRARGIDGARNRSRSTDQLVGRWLARVNRNDDVAGEPTPSPFVNRPGPYLSVSLPASTLSRTLTRSRTQTRIGESGARAATNTRRRAGHHHEHRQISVWTVTGRTNGID